MAPHDKQKLIFTDLPNEIQFKILHLTYEPRIIVLDWSLLELWALEIPGKKVNIPVALHINHKL
jgi:hypothetical protein